jgi:hypothetical protein
MEEDYDIGHSIRTSLIPEAVLWYTGEAIEEDDEGDYEEVRHDCTCLRPVLSARTCHFCCSSFLAAESFRPLRCTCLSCISPRVCVCVCFALQGDEDDDEDEDAEEDDDEEVQ